MVGRTDPQWMEGKKIVAGDRIRHRKKEWLVTKTWLSEDGMRMAELREPVPNPGKTWELALVPDEEYYVVEPSLFSRPGDEKWWE